LTNKRFAQPRGFINITKLHHPSWAEKKKIIVGHKAIEVETLFQVKELIYDVSWTANPNLVPEHGSLRWLAKIALKRTSSPGISGHKWDGKVWNHGCLQLSGAIKEVPVYPWDPVQIGPFASNTPRGLASIAQAFEESQKCYFSLSRYDVIDVGVGKQLGCV